MHKDILVIDDNPDIRFLICNILKEAAEEKIETAESRIKELQLLIEHWRKQIETNTKDN